MPFQLITELPAPNPTVKIFFHGLLVLRSPDGTYCLVEPHFGPHAVPHTLSIEVRTKSPNNPDVIVLRRYDKPSTTVSIEVRPARASPHAYKYQPSPVFNPDLGAGTGLERDDDFRWIIDFQKLYPAKTLSIDTAKTRPGITFLRGDYYFLTAQRKLHAVFGAPPGSIITPPPPRTAIASIIGANVYLNSALQEQLVLKWDATGAELPLKIPAVAGAYHEIYIENSPLFAEADSSHDEFAEYYDIIQDGLEPGGLENEHLTIGFPNDPAFTEGSAKHDTEALTPRIPCQPVVIEG